MRIDLDRVAKGPKFAALPPTSVSFATGEATLARAETEQRPTVLGLIASGRMRPDAGTVLIDGEQDYTMIRRQVALIDAPSVCEPTSDVTVFGVVAEELMFAGRPSNPQAVRKLLDELGETQWARYSIGTVPPTVRIKLLTELAILRSGVEGLVITSPDRHGGDPNSWWRIALDLAGRGYAVLVVAGDASAAAIAASALVERIQETSALPLDRIRREISGDSTDEDPDEPRSITVIPDETEVPEEGQNENEDQA